MPRQVLASTAQCRLLAFILFFGSFVPISPSLAVFLHNNCSEGCATDQCLPTDYGYRCAANTDMLAIDADPSAYLKDSDWADYLLASGVVTPAGSGTRDADDSYLWNDFFRADGLLAASNDIAVRVLAPAASVGYTRRPEVTSSELPALPAEHIDTASQSQSNLKTDNLLLLGLAFFGPALLYIGIASISYFRRKRIQAKIAELELAYDPFCRTLNRAGIEWRPGTAGNVIVDNPFRIEIWLTTGQWRWGNGTEDHERQGTGDEFALWLRGELVKRGDSSATNIEGQIAGLAALQRKPEVRQELKSAPGSEPQRIVKSASTSANLATVSARPIAKSRTVSEPAVEFPRGAARKSDHAEGSVGIEEVTRERSRFKDSDDPDLDRLKVLWKEASKDTRTAFLAWVAGLS